MANEIVVKMSGSDNLSSVASEAQRNVSGSFKRMADDASSSGKAMSRAAGEGFDRIGEGADNTERRIMGFRDGLTGTGDVMKGLRDGDMLTFATGMGDLASAVSNLGVDVLKSAAALGRKAAAYAASTAATVAHTAATVATTVATNAMAAAQWLLNAAMSANPIMLVVIGLAALVAAFVLAWKHSETFREIVTGAFDKVMEIAQGTWNWIKDNWPLLLAILTGPFGLAVLAIVRNWDEIKGAAGAAKDWVVERMGDLIGFFTGMPGKIAGATAGMFTGIYDSFKAAINSVIRAWNDFELGFSWGGKDMPGPIPDVPGFDIKIGTPNIPYLAKGGITSGPMLAMIGDNPSGREAVIPLDDPRARDLLGGGGGASIVINVNALDPKAAARAVVAALKDARTYGLTTVSV